MNRLEDNQNPQQGEEIDLLLRAFYQAQMPKPWPAFQPPRHEKARPSAASQPSRFAIGSKFALALSLGLLMLCGWLLSGGAPSSRKAVPPIDHTGGTATKGGNRPFTAPADRKPGEVGRDQGEEPDLGFDQRDLFPNR